MTPERNLFWNIQSVWIFYVLTSLSIALFIYGLLSHMAVWKKGIKRQQIPFSFHNFISVALDGLSGKKILSGDLSAGIMHLLILWGFLGLFAGTLLSAFDHYISHFLKNRIYLIYSSGLEIAGLMLIVGLGWALIRRYIQRVKRLEKRLEDLVVPGWLLIVTISGFLLEGLRLAVQKPEWVPWSFAGYLISLACPDAMAATRLYLFMWWLHSALALVLIAAIPFCKLFHALAAPVNIYLKNQPLQIIPIGNTGDSVFSCRDMVSFDACTRCGRCVEVCPSNNAGEPFAPRKFITSAKNNVSYKYGLALLKSRRSEIDTNNIWNCTTCRACLEVCPVYVSPLDPIRTVRSKEIEKGTRVPSLLIQSLEKLYRYNNPWESSKKKRSRWLKNLDCSDITLSDKIKGFCYFVGCTTSIDTRAQGMALAFVKILNHAQEPFGTLGKKEPCCGDIARRVGEDGLFEDHLENCLTLFKRYAVQKIVTSSPHCFHTLKNEYPAFEHLKPIDQGVVFSVRHYTQILRDLLATGSLQFQKTISKKITYHDPCYLGRHNRIFKPPREVISAIPGINLLEMDHHGPNSRCCGGGGGRMWQEDLDADIKMSEIRINEAAATGADILVTACPLCLIMLEDARKTVGLEDSLQVLDLNELVAIALDLNDP